MRVRAPRRVRLQSPGMRGGAVREVCVQLRLAGGYSKVLAVPAVLGCRHCIELLAKEWSWNIISDVYS